MAKKQYKNLPIEEVVVGINFTEDSPWDITFPGLLFEKIKDSFSEKEQLNRLVLNLGIREGSLETKQVIGEMPSFSTPDKTMRIELTRDSLVIRHLKPYIGWDRFMEVIKKVLGARWGIADATTANLELLYTNKFKFEGAVDLSQTYLNIFPGLKGKLDAVQYTAFITGIMGEASNMVGTECLPDDIIRIEAVSVSELTVALNLLFFNNKIRYSQAKEVSGWLQRAHEALNQVFEASITEEIRKTFGDENL
jgi:uncharacterized protein (TIGR04255 family)